MFGTKHPFEYEQCASCDSIQICAVPDNALLARYYPKDYY